MRRASSSDPRGKLGFISSRSSRIGPHLEMKCGTWCSSCVVARNSGFLSSGIGNLGEHLELHNGSQTFFQVVTGQSGLHSRHFRGIGSHPTLRGESHGFLELWWKARGSFPGAVGTPGNLSCCHSGVGPPFELHKAPRDSSLVAAGE